MENTVLIYHNYHQYTQIPKNEYLNIIVTKNEEEFDLSEESWKVDLERPDPIVKCLCAAANFSDINSRELYLYSKDPSKLFKDGVSRFIGKSFVEYCPDIDTMSLFYKRLYYLLLYITKNKATNIAFTSLILEDRLGSYDLSIEIPNPYGVGCVGVTTIKFLNSELVSEFFSIFSSIDFNIRSGKHNRW